VFRVFPLSLWRGGEQFNVVESCGVVAVGDAFDAEGVAGFQGDAVDDVAGGVVGVWIFGMAATVS